MTLQGMYNHPMKGLDTIVKSVKKYFLKKLDFTDILGLFMKELDTTVKSVKK